MGKYDVLDPFLKRCLFPRSGPLHCAVSGGADSAALLILASLTGANVVAHHVDHGLRPNGKDESNHVEKLASQVGADFPVPLDTVSVAELEEELAVDVGGFFIFAAFAAIAPFWCFCTVRGSAAARLACAPIVLRDSASAFRSSW